jgi:hypothetical protein
MPRRPQQRVDESKEPENTFLSQIIWDQFKEIFLTGQKRVENLRLPPDANDHAFQHAECKPFPLE